MDAVFWGPEWSESPDSVFFPTLESHLSAPAWVLDGNYTRTIAIKWREVDIVVWLDYHFTRTSYQSISRALSRSISGDELWPGTGNRESFSRMFSRDSIIWWCVKSYRKNRRKYEAMMQDPQYSHIRFVRLQTPTQARAYLESVAARTD